MVHFTSAPTALAASTASAASTAFAAPVAFAVAAHAEKTERSPLLYAWWALNLAVLIAVGYGVYRLVRSLRAKRATRRG